MKAQPFPYPCVVLDLDDTLFLERDYVLSGFRAVGAYVDRRLEAPGFAERAWKRFVEGQRGDTFDAVLGELGIAPSPELITELVAVYRAHEPDIAMLPDAREALERLRSNATLAVITDGPLESQLAKARAMGVTEWSKVSVFTAEWGPGFGKPHRRAFEWVEAETGCGGDACAYLADNPVKDFVAPHELGWRTVRIRRPLSLHTSIESGPDVDAEVPDLLAALDVLESGVGNRR